MIMKQLTAEEQDFIVQTLQNVQLSGSPESLRQALSLIDSITEKLAENLEDADKTRNPHLLP